MLREGPRSRVVAADSAVEVHLPETPSTGYRWHLDEPGEHVTIVDTAYHDGSAMPLAGGAGTRVFRLRVARTDGHDLTFLLRRPWETPEHAIERRIVTVVPGEPR